MRLGRTFWGVVVAAVALGVAATIVLGVSPFGAITTALVAGACIGYLVDQQP